MVEIYKVDSLLYLIMKFLRLLTFSIDNCDNTGDHENFFGDSTDAYEIDGTKYRNCIKKAVRYRSKYEQKLISSLTEVVFLLFDGYNYFPVDNTHLSNTNGILNPKFS